MINGPYTQVYQIIQMSQVELIDYRFLFLPVVICMSKQNKNDSIRCVVRKVAAYLRMLLPSLASNPTFSNKKTFQINYRYKCLGKLKVTQRALWRRSNGHYPLNKV